MTGRISLELREEKERVVGIEIYRTYDFNIRHPQSTKPIGVINLRNSYHLEFTLYHGNVGYEIDPQWRGRGFAAEACQLLKAFAISKGMKVLWITCSPANLASIKTIAKLGAHYLGTVQIPLSHNLREKLGVMSRRRYKWEIQG